MGATPKGFGEKGRGGVLGSQIFGQVPARKGKKKCVCAGGWQMLSPGLHFKSEVVYFKTRQEVTLEDCSCRGNGSGKCVKTFLGRTNKRLPTLDRAPKISQRNDLALV